MSSSPDAGRSRVGGSRVGAYHRGGMEEANRSYAGKILGAGPAAGPTAVPANPATATTTTPTRTPQNDEPPCINEERRKAQLRRMRT